jgi:hypothetical protein
MEGASDIVVYRLYTLSITQQMAEDGQYFGYVNPSEALRDLVIPVSFDTAVFVDDKGHTVALPQSNRLPLNQQKRMIEDDFSRRLRVEGTRAAMLHAPHWTQLDIRHQKETGDKLLVGLYARTPDKTVDSFVAAVGRIHPDLRLNVGGWLRDGGRDDVWAVPAVVSRHLGF